MSTEKPGNGTTDDYVSTKIRIPYFDPDKQTMTAKGWLQFVELARKSAGYNSYDVKKGGTGPDAETMVKKYTLKWNDEMTCTNAMLMLQGAGSRWIENILETKGIEMTDWSMFKKAFKKRFVRALTLTEKMNLRDLKMTGSESCTDFYDRCQNNINLFYDDEWEKLDLEEVDQEVVKTTKEIELKLAFASGLRETIKKQVLFHDSKTIDDILVIAQRIESALKEVKKSEIAGVNVNDENENDVDVGAVNFRQKKKSVTTYNAGGGGKSSFKCFYCQKPGHYKAKCMTMINDRKKGVYRSNVNAPINQNSKTKVSSVDAEDESHEDDNDSGINNCQVDLAKFLNLNSA